MVEYTNTRRQTPATGTERWASGTPNLLIYTPYASRRQMDIIGWKRDDFPQNRNEQGGWLIGHYIHDAFGRPIQAEVTELFQAKTECRYPGYIEWSALEEIRMQQEFFRMKEELALTDPSGAEELAVIGWWHTHPNDLPVFMSGTDMETQRLKYFRPEKYAVVLNPHTGIWRAFAGKDAVEVAAVMLLDERKEHAVANPVPEKHAKNVSDRNCRKQNRHQKRCRSKRKAKKRK